MLIKKINLSSKEMHEACRSQSQVDMAKSNIQEFKSFGEAFFES